MLGGKDEDKKTVGLGSNTEHKFGKSSSIASLTKTGQNIPFFS